MAEQILIVEDDEELQTLYGLYLQGESYQIHRAHNGLQALASLDEALPNVIVLDMIMPEMDGESFLKEFKARAKYGNVPIIIASVNDKIPQQLLDIPNVFAVLKKPFTIETLVAKVKEAIASPS